MLQKQIYPGSVSPTRPALYDRRWRRDGRYRDEVAPISIYSTRHFAANRAAAAAAAAVAAEDDDDDDDDDESVDGDGRRSPTT